MIKFVLLFNLVWLNGCAHFAVFHDVDGYVYCKDQKPARVIYIYEGHDQAYSWYLSCEKQRWQK